MTIRKNGEDLQLAFDFVVGILFLLADFYDLILCVRIILSYACEVIYVFSVVRFALLI